MYREREREIEFIAIYTYVLLYATVALCSRTSMHMDIGGKGCSATRTAGRMSAAFVVLKMLVPKIPESRVREHDHQNRIQDLQGPPTNLRSVEMSKI